jgi:hypothetical protein|tara:strand:+ start:22 stop:183 length:162 start_codon:yes stop_codon:yes gene_type:complete
MIKFLKKIFARWFGRKEVVQLTEEAVVPVEKPIHCKDHSRFKKSCSLCQEIIK